MWMLGIKAGSSARAAKAHNAKPSLQPVTRDLLEGTAPQSDLFVSGSAPLRVHTIDELENAEETLLTLKWNVSSIFPLNFSANQHSSKCFFSPLVHYFPTACPLLLYFR